VSDDWFDAAAHELILRRALLALRIPPAALAFGPPRWRAFVSRLAHWRSVKFTDHWEEEEPDGTILIHDRERFSHELTLIFSCGKTQILTHEKQNPS